MAKRLAFRIVIITVLAATGFIFLLRSCLAKFDERAAIGGGGSSQAASQFLVFEKDGKGVIFSLVQYDRTTSYSRKGGSTNKSIVRTFYAQTNDLATAAKTGSQKIKKGHDIKAYPVELMGAASDKAWLFAGELMAYDPFTLTRLADAAIIEEKNPVLKGKLINERRYYEFDNDSKQIRITAADGSIYDLNPNTLVASAADEGKTVNAADKKIKELDKYTADLREVQKAAYDRLREANRKYQEKLLSAKQYSDSADAIGKEVKPMDRQFDSLEVLIRDVKSQQRTEEQTINRKKNARRTGGGFTGMKTNTDTLYGRWYALFTNEELEKAGEHFDHQALYNESARNKLFTAVVTLKENNWIIAGEKTTAGEAVYLQGGFLLSKETGLPVHLQNGFLIVHKDRIGNDGVVQLTRITTDGKQMWSISTGLKEFYDWQLRGDKLIVAGTDNKDLSSGEVNLLQVINLQNGAVVAYDFFTDKIRAGK
ncbi:MAG TPA: PA2928 family protein [Chitinophagaceae bacterium]|jgi:hypothetical protein|nr:PA2928 family protein [Chitinophagaceae bacterium]